MALDSLELRLQTLEDLIIGTRRKHIQPSEIRKPIFDHLFTAHAALASAEKRPIIARMLARTTELQKYMDPHFMEDESLSAKAKVEIILAEKEKIENAAVALERIRAISEVLNHPAFRELSTLRKRLNELNNVFLTQQEKSTAAIAEGRVLLDSYYSVLFNLSKLFIQCNQRLTTESQQD
ncbi:hypothetical protein FBUS_06958 [Fasciolopsis buskii]|uniref:Dynactin subunit 3 n=1 Tax=Fasciolopsis buskii TaxID=27845 RepID=A0A8E0RX11_9TREM|nr:hypothetical protein FBUS_06958 [Fasciolopsis buski]